ncbi:hypothetical protein E4188_23155 (plasmid) [Aeromonas media]|uniref:Uncharacterized protein n=2 Tax=Aeromonas TaxID=642 RepID=A0ABX6NYG2_AERME|nr:MULTISPECIES: hypothetical protein [Aeromonas]ASI21396.1 hypothetical protein CE456_00705 [Aeromonas salmonicida]QJT41400.1 hypothetical protein E4188_23155 [Aeromonas media]QLI60440.1 hypothetical protein C1C91_22675 [Aeromonas caviae]HDN9374634.1 hypothetical protein [Aeromonas salmonicida]HDN9378943.1 hypothetical protein [Aeromonas salmonicida]
MEVRDIIELLRAGWELANRGMGWYLSAPPKPYHKKVQHLIGDELVNYMERAGLIKMAMPYNTINAVLVEERR